MSRPVVGASFVLAVLSFSSLAQANEALSMEQALREAVTASPLLKAASDRIESSSGQVVQAGLRPNPRLVVQQENARAWEFSRAGDLQPGFVFTRDTDTYVYGAQLIERGGKRERRVEFAAAARDRSRADRDALEQQIRVRVASAYWIALSASKIRDLYRSDTDTFAQIVADQRNRVQEGAAPGADLLRLQVEQERLVAALETAGIEADRARVTLLREMGRTTFPDVELTQSLDTLPVVEFKDIREVFRQRRDIEALRQAIAQAESNARLQRANAKVDPELQFGYKRTFGFDTLYAAVNVPLPIRNRNQGNIASADADVRIAQANLDAAERQVRAEVETATSEYRKRQRILNETLRPLVDNAQHSLEIAQGAYREGGFDLLRYLDAQRSRIEAQTLYFRALGELHLSAVAVAQAQGDF